MDPFDLVGDVLDGQFKIEEFVGEGALSVVYRARNEGVSAPVAVKCLNLPSTLDPTFASSVVEGFQEGCKLHYRLARGHLAIAQTFASGTTVAPRTGAQVPYIVREWFEGESLARDFRRRRTEGEHGRTLAETLALFEPIASALSYAHAQDAAHLSLMPSNMFLAKTADDEVTLKLLDFGVGRVVDEAASTRNGAPAPPRIKILLPTYAAPEQLLSSLGPTGPWSDVYALALVLLEALSDNPVMGAKDASALVARALSAKSRPSPKEHGVELPPGVDRVLTRALALEPESRQASVAEMWAELVAEAKPVRNERRHFATFLRRLRRARKIDARGDEPKNGDAFPEHEPPTAKARGVVAMLTARVRASTRPPPPLVKKVSRAPAKSAAAPALAKSTLKTKTKAPSPVTSAPREEPTASPTASPPPGVTAASWAALAAPPLPVFPKTTQPLTSVPPPSDPEPPPAPPPQPTEPKAPSANLPSAVITRGAFPPPIPPPSFVVAPASPPTSEVTEPHVPLASLFAQPEPPPPPPAVIESSGRLEPHEIPVLASPFAKPRRPIPKRVMLAIAGAGGALVLGVAAIVVVHSVTKAHAVTSPVASVTPTATTPPIATSAPATLTTTTPSATVTTASAHTGHFNKRVALAAIADATSDLSSCSRHGGVWGIGQAGVIFNNDGTVRRVMMSPPFTGVEGKCVTEKISQARIDPFPGLIGPIYAKFVIPYQ